MSQRENRRFRVRARGEIACFTRPEMKVERVSYEVMTPSAARGLLESILWKPAMHWRIHAIEVLSPIRWMSVRRNEVNGRASLDKKHLVADEDRAQRNTVALRDVDYVLEASVVLTRRAGQGDTPRKFEEMFERRLARGQHHSAPYFGCREFAAAVEPAVDTPPPIELTVDRPLGWMFYDFDWSGYDGQCSHKGSGAGAPLFFEARLCGGVVHVPPREMLRSPEGAPS